MIQVLLTTLPIAMESLQDVEDELPGALVL